MKVSLCYLLSTIAVSTLLSCGDIHTAFFIRSDSTAIIRYTYLAEREIRDTSTTFRRVVFSLDSTLSILRKEGSIRGFRRSPVLARQYVELDIELDHYRRIDSIHRVLYAAIAPNDKIGLRGVDKGMRDSVAFRRQGDSIHMQILNWIPDTAMAKRSMVEGIEQMRIMAIKLDSIQLEKGGLDSVRAARRSAVLRTTPDLQSMSLQELSQSAIGKYAIPARHYSLNAPLVLGDEGEQFVGVGTARSMTQASWYLMSYRPDHVSEDLGKTPTIWFKLTMPAQTDRLAWTNALGVCEECEEGFKQSGAQGSGLRFYSNGKGVTYMLVDCGRDVIARRTIIVRLGHNDSAGYFGASQRLVAMQAQVSSDTLLSWASDRLVGDVTLDEASGLLNVNHEVGKHGVRITYDLNETEPHALSIMRKDRSVWINHRFESGKEKFISRDPIRCASR